MPRWLFKEEPSEYSYADLEHDGSAIWEGVANPLALKHLRAVRPGDEVFFYHTGKEKAVVGVMRVTAATTDDEGSPVVTMTPLRELAYPVSLAAIKAELLFADWELVRLSRLSVMPVPDELWKRIEELAKQPPSASGKTKKAAG
jgi:predicted RNA-binding protein with PUA-like domain